MSGQIQLNINGTPVAVTDPTARAMIAEIQSLIPSEASSTNQLADKDFVNSTAATNTATFRGTYNLVSDLGLTISATQQQIAAALATEVAVADNNDYAYVQIPTAASKPTEIARIDRYKFNGTAWGYEYSLNNSGFTADQWAAINSYITSDLVYKLQRLPDANTLSTLLNGKQDVISDLSTIRSGSQAGATAVQPAALEQAVGNEVARSEEAYAKQTGYYETLGAGTATNIRGVNPTEGTFTIRPTGGTTDVATGTAYLERIKGNTLKWNQLLRANKLVDMGLPSGTLWATCDIDVTKADKFCETPFTYEKSFFSWGNIDGHNPISNNAFDYDWGSVNSEEPWYEGQVYGETQGNTLTSNIPANATYDAARSHLGASWRMPTSAEFVELLNNTKFINADGTEVDTTKTDKRVTVNGILGLYIESRINGARLFFSCSGLGAGRSWNSRGSRGHYWSSAFDSARNARNLYFFYSGGVSPQSSGNRYYGFTIRPVTNSAIVTDENGHKYAVSGKYIIDLTLMYGEGNEPSTIAQFEQDYFKWFGKHLTSEGYTEGELRDMKMSAIKTTGFNAFNLSTGKAKLIGGQEYEVVGTYTGLTIDGESVTLVDGKFTPAQSCELVVAGGDSTTCVHLVHSGKRNGENESYWEETKNVPVTTLTGKLNGEGESVIVFPDGMKSVGEVQDDILIENGKTYAIVKIQSRAYQEGDVDGETMITDGTTTYVTIATPLVYELDNFQLPLPYRVDDYGTEEVTGAEKSVAPTLDIRYGINAGDTITNLPKNYISAESIDQLLATMSSAMGGTWTKTWDAANGRYTFSFTPAVTLNLAPTEPEPEEES